MRTENAVLYYRWLRAARIKAQDDSENWEILVQAFERIGQMEKGKQCNGLGAYKEFLIKIADDCYQGNEHAPLYQTPPAVLFDLIKESRNSAIHTGFAARNLVRHCIDFSIHLEVSILPCMHKIKDIMIQGVEVAELNHPLGHIRKIMLSNSYCHLPVRYKEDWFIVSDYKLANLCAMSTVMPKELAVKSLRDLIEEDGDSLISRATIIAPQTAIEEARRIIKELPLLIAEKGNQHLLGIITAYDLL